MYFDVCRDMELTHHKYIGTGLASYNGRLNYLVDPELWVPGKMTFTDDDNEFPTYIVDTAPEYPTGGYLYIYMDYVQQISVVTGQKQYTGALYADHARRTPAYYAGRVPQDPLSAREWSVSDGNQTIYFSKDYAENYTSIYSPFGSPVVYTTYVGYGDDNDGSIMDDRGSGFDSPYDLNFKENIIAPLVISAYPYLSLRMQKDTQDYLVYTPVNSGNIDLFYAYRPLDQPKIIRQRWSVFFDGDDERLSSWTKGTPTQLLGLVDHFTVMAWVDRSGSEIDEQRIFMHGNGSNANRIHLSYKTQDGGAYIVDIMDDTTQQKVYRFWLNPPSDWVLVGLTWDGTTDTLRCFANGEESEVLTYVIDDSPLVMKDSLRYMGVGGMPTLLDHTGFGGLIHQTYSWSTVLSDAEIYYLYHNESKANMNWLRNHGDYVSAASLEHWYRPGLEDSPNFGKDYGLTPFDLVEEGLGSENRYPSWP